MKLIFKDQASVRPEMSKLLPLFLAEGFWELKSVRIIR